MFDRSRDTAFTAFVARDRKILLGATFLMFGSLSRADDVVSATLARLYGEWPGLRGARRSALAQVLSGLPVSGDVSGRPRVRFELVDVALHESPRLVGVLADLAELDPQTRRAVILDRYVGLSPVELAEVLDTDQGPGQSLAERAVYELAARDPSRAVATILNEQLKAAAAATDTLPASESAEDLSRGRLVLRRRRARWAVAAVTVGVVALLGATQIFPASRPGQLDGAPTPSTGPTPSAAACSPREESCEAGLVRRWRNQTSAIAISYLDPGQRYFSGYTFSYDDSYDSPGYWRGDGGVLGFDLFRLDAGSTEVYIQIASSSAFALKCGQMTRHVCLPLQAVGGSVYSVTDSSTVSEGMEAQFSPNGRYVISVVARNTTGGRSLRITMAQLLTLISDARLRLPIG